MRGCKDAGRARLETGRLATGSHSAPEAGTTDREREEGALGARTSHHLWPVRWRLSLRQERAGAPLIRGRYAACATAGRRWHAGRWVAVVVALIKGKAEEGWPSEQQSNATQRSRQNDKTGGGAASKSDEIAWRITRRRCWW